VLLARTLKAGGKAPDLSLAKARRKIMLPPGFRL
jgi:hypothetical protein